MVKLTNIKNKAVKNFSLGMKQRLGMARAIITKPELVILDEPINGLDPVEIREIRDLIKLLNQEYGITFLISTNILGEIEQIADTIGIIKDGKMLDEVTIGDIQKKQTDYMELITSDVTKAVYILEHELQISNLKIKEENQIRVYDLSKSQKEISKVLITNDIDIEEIHRHSSSLEDCFFHQIHGVDLLTNLISLEWNKLKKHSIMIEAIIYLFSVLGTSFLFLTLIDFGFNESYESAVHLVNLIQPYGIYFVWSIIDQPSCHRRIQK
jgi:ABC-2 type transport system ATP-binding protein